MSLLLRRASILLAGLLASLAAAAASAEIPAVERARASVTTARSAWLKAHASVEAARARSDELAHRVAALKRLGARGAAGGQLEVLLQESLEIGHKLEALAQARDARAAEVRAAVAAAARTVDGEIRRIKPGLESRATQREAARQLKALLAIRGELKEELASLEAAPRRPRAWAQYEVSIEPLDGPRELGDKADFLEDTRDKFEKKRAELARLIQEARQAREIARASENFRTDTSLFDEEVRTGRVSRRAGGLATLSQPRIAGDQPAAGPAPGNAEAEAPARGGATQAAGGGGAEPSAGAAPPPAPQDDFDFAGNRAGAGDPSTAGDAAPPPAPPAAPAATGFTGLLPKQIDPDRLLNLDVTRLDAGALDVEQLEALMGNLEQLDAHLRERAAQIRRRAERLEEDEARVLGAQ